ncbi:MAG: erythromycin esterase family protein [Gemmatimonadota bacterium]
MDRSAPLAPQLEALGRTIGDSHIVLLGENGHGVGSISEIKAELTTVDALHACLRYPFEHAELLPVFQRVKVSHGTARPLALMGMDIQAQGFDSEPRPAYSLATLAGSDPELARRIAALDSALYLVEASGGLGSGIYAWAAANGDSARALYRQAAAASNGWDRWTFELAAGWIDRLQIRGAAELADADTPVRYYEIRDEWMARAVSALADSIDGRRRVAVWLHNDHARYGAFPAGTGMSRSTGGYLKDLYGKAVFSIGFFMGSGQIADNGRNARETVPAPEGSIESVMATPGADATYLLVRGNRDPEVTGWASIATPYLRMGIEPLEMTPLEEFDALFYVGQATVPDIGSGKRRHPPGGLDADRAVTSAPAAAPDRMGCSRFRRAGWDVALVAGRRGA